MKNNKEEDEIEEEKEGKKGKVYGDPVVNVDFD